MKRVFIPVVLLVACCFSNISAQDTESVPGKISVTNRNWQKGGIFQEYNPSQEILSGRTEFTKKFDYID
jgi:hypothetical protein